MMHNNLEYFVELLLDSSKIDPIQEPQVKELASEILYRNDFNQLEEAELQFLLAASLFSSHYLNSDYALREKLANQLVLKFPNNKLNWFLQFRACIYSNEIAGKAPARAYDYALKLYPFILNPLVADTFMIWCLYDIYLPKEQKVPLLQKYIMNLEIQMDMLKGDDLFATVDIVKNFYFFINDFEKVLYFSRKYGHYNTVFVTAVRKMEGPEVAFEEALNHGFTNRGESRVGMLLDGTLTPNERKESIEMLLATTYIAPKEFIRIAEPKVLPFLER